jgi:ribosomal protein S18 acetylase RimI-like enzyme
MTVEFPDGSVGEFPLPPREISDGDGRPITLREAEPGDQRGLVDMYVEFNPEDRAQGIPPSGESDVQDWLDTVSDGDSLTVVAVHEGDIVGHGMLVPDPDESYELALFVLRDYQGAGIGTELLRTLLGLGRKRGVERVWLSVERWNDAAIAVYKKVGFERTGSASFELEMALRL